jgi:hypothetical protein
MITHQDKKEKHGRGEGEGEQARRSRLVKL